LRPPPTAPLFPYTTLFRSYKVMMKDARASRLLSHDQVRGRLQPAMQRWIGALLHANPDTVESLIAAQRVVGDVHARVGIPVDLRSEEHTSELQSRENLVCR